jgi:hypothetical protein
MGTHKPKLTFWITLALLTYGLLLATDGFASEPSWIAEGERLAAAEMAGTPDACAGKTVRYGIKELPAGIAGWAFINDGAVPRDECYFEITAAAAATRCGFVTIYAHERAHLWRNDGWHSESMDSILYPTTDNHVNRRCVSRENGISRTDAKAAVAARVGLGWRLRTHSAWFDDYGTQSSVIVTAKRGRGDGARVRDFLVQRVKGALTIQRW